MSRRNPAPKPKRRTRITIPEKAGPHIRLIFAEMGRQRITYQELAWRAGVLVATFKAWRHKNSPSFQNLAAAYNALGWDLVPIPAGRVVSPDILSELAPIADRLGLDMQDALQFATELALGRHDRPNSSKVAA